MSMTVCPYHRFTLGINWRRSTKCKNPGHEGKEKIHRSINVKLSKDVLYKLGYLLPVGSGVCKTCYGQIAEMVTDTAETSDKCENSSHKIEDSCNLVHGYELRPRTKSNYNEQSETVAVFQDGSQSTCETEMLSQTSNWSDEIHCQDSLEDLNQYLQKHSISPVKYPLRKNISDIQESTARYYKRKANEAIEDVLNAIAPGQSSSLLGLCVNKEPSTSQYDIEETVIRLYIETADANIRCQLLSSICTNLSKKELMGRIPGLTKYQVDKARMFAAEAGDKNIGLRVVPKKKFRRDRMGKDKLEHCLSFFFDNMFVQIVAHGVREMQLDSGETLEIPDVVRTAFHSTMVQMYEAFCRETNFEPLSTSSLFKILKACPASKRKNLHGLDNITADGISAYDTILEVAKRFNTHEIYKELERKIHESKFYMKTDYKTHIKDFDLCADHCRTYALSHPTDKSLQEICPHEHTIQCDRCNLLYEVEKALQELVDQEIDGTEKDVMKFDLKNAMKHILNWKAHIVRTTNQDQCRIDILDCLQPSQVLIVMDWAMKFLPIFFREKQSDWFAQKGKNWHVTVCITRDENGKLKHSTYTHVLESRQDWFAVFSILENVLSTLKTQKPHLEEAFIRSDNAGCYHCGHIWLALHEIRAKTGITIQRIDYSEPQAGKSYCDSKIAHMRSRLRTYAASGNDVSSLSDMKKAIDSNGGVVGCQVSVVEIDATQQHIKNHKWKGVNSVNHLAFENGGIRVWRMYKIGAGKLITADQVKTYCSQKQFQGGLKILEEFTVPSVAFGSITHKEHNPIGTLEGVPESVMRTSNNNDEQSEDEEEVADIFSCPEVGCSRVFKTYRGLESHILLGKHVLNLQKESTYDQIRRKWADCCNETKFGVTAAAGTSPDTSGQEVVACHLTMGWALKKERVATRFTENTREFLRNCFEEGEVTNKKANPHDVATKMKHLKDDNRHAVFKPEEWLLPGQIMSYFSRLTAQQGNQRRSVIECDEDLVAVMTALDDDNIRDCVINEIL